MEKRSLKFIITVLLMQILTSLPIRYFYFSYNNYYLMQVACTVLSISFIIISSYLTIRLNKSLNSNFNGIITSLILIMPFIALVLIANKIDNQVYKQTIFDFLGYTFLHLGGLGPILHKVFGFKALYNLFYSVNITILIHILGFFLGDIYYIVGKKRHAKV
ncbi:hypothetical protein [Alkaliphilus hydrothermalis]|uniref:Uncharacterized protein n=1 Tax=Alkaliphilus hydrothermalis TaxID=1482730 RepID=A0ABS2NTP1_9FIRM|nr:hypothetical protein [Alkaliphilus hydrothermalis]MBM7616271.1 hypothetical protein [Alkaliphilus hydrothermalis]